MKISSRVDYALACILRIADKYNTKKPVSVSYVAKKEGIEFDYAEQLLIRMKRHGILNGIRGAYGGYILARSPSLITAKDVVEAIDNNILEPVCSRKKGRRKDCVHITDCKVKRLWLGLKKDMEGFLKRYTLEGLVRLRRKERLW